MPSTSLPSDADSPTAGVLHDGLSARAWPVAVHRTGSTVCIERDAGEAETLPLAQLRRGTVADAGVTVHRLDRPDWRLVLRDVADDAWPRQLADVARLSAAARRAYAMAALVLCGLVGAGWWFGDAALGWAAPLVPQRVSAPIGKGLVRDLGHACASPAGRQAMATLVMRLRPARGFVEPVTVTIIDAPIRNALAVPGGQVVLFRKIISDARSPDEVAGVLAHELAHVQNRHPTKALIRQMGVSLLARALGGDTGGIVDLALLLRQSRAAEAEADADAIAMLRSAGINPAALAGFFDRQDREAKQDKGIAKQLLEQIGEYGATHPGNAERANRLRAAALTGAAPALTVAQWTALRMTCTRPAPTAPPRTKATPARAAD